MPDREKAIRILEGNYKNFVLRHNGELLTVNELIALLKAHEPRVMDFDDVVGGDECWLEAINGACGYADCYACTGTGEVQVFRCKHDNPQYIMARDYLKTWRCWTSRPDQATREATPWE